MLLGKLLYWVNELEKWQISPYFKGVAGTGKGLLVKLFPMIFHPSNIGVMTNNIEEKFGLASLANEDIFCITAPEIQENITLDQTQFQSMVSGEAVTYAVKNQNSRTKMNWEKPIIMASNVFPNWNDNSGSLQRRLIILNFHKHIPDEKKR